MKLPYGLMIDGSDRVAIDDVKAKVVQNIFTSYLSGKSLAGICVMLEEAHTPSPSGRPSWTPAAVSNLLFNRKYIAVVGLEKYFGVQIEKDRRSNIDEATGKRKTARYDSRNVLSGLIICGECGRNYRRVRRASGEMVWRCANRVEHGKTFCKSAPTVTETDLIAFLCDKLGTKQFNPQKVKRAVEAITVFQDGYLSLETNSNPTNIKEYDCGLSLIML
jgi:hypothetical protein